MNACALSVPFWQDRRRANRVRATDCSKLRQRDSHKHLHSFNRMHSAQSVPEAESVPSRKRPTRLGAGFLPDARINRGGNPGHSIDGDTIACGVADLERFATPATGRLFLQEAPSRISSYDIG